MIEEKIRDNVYEEFRKLFGNDRAKLIEKSIYMFSEDYAESNNTPFLLQNIYENKANELLCLLGGKNLEIVIKALVNKKIDLNTQINQHELILGA